MINSTSFNLKKLVVYIYIYMRKILDKWKYLKRLKVLSSGCWGHKIMCYGMVGITLLEYQLIKLTGTKKKEKKVMFLF